MLEYFEKRTMKKTVVILLSDKRSGSTMFQRELCKHADIQTVAYSPHTYLETHHWLKAAVMLQLPPSSFSGGKVYGGYGSRKNARLYMEDCIRKNVPDFKIPKDDRALIFEGWEALCDRFASPVFFEKSPQFLAHWGCLELLLEWIEQTTFNVKVIGLTRNPLSVLYSAQALFYTDPQKRQHGWVEIHQNLERVQARLSPEEFMLCRYEDLVQQPAQAFNTIARFIDVPTQQAVGAGIHSSSVNKWATDPFFTFRLAKTTKEMAKRLNYTDSELENPEKPLPSRLLRLGHKVKGAVYLSAARYKDRCVIPTLLRLKKIF